MLPVNANATLLINKTQPERPDAPAQNEQDIWFDALDYIELKDVWSMDREGRHTPANNAGETADSQIPFTEDCRRGIQRLMRTLGGYEESKLFSACLSAILPGTPLSLVMAANTLYTAVIDRTQIDVAAIQALGLTSVWLPDNINIISQLAAVIRDTINGWTNETFLQGFMDDNENAPSSYLFIALAVVSLVAGRWMEDEGAPQRGLLKVPAFVANLFIRTSYYWNALGRMAQSGLPSLNTTGNSSPQVPAFEVDTLIEMREVAHSSGSFSAPQITAFCANSTATPQAYAHATVLNKPVPASGRGDLSDAERVHRLAVERLRQHSGLSNLLSCSTQKTQTRVQTNAQIVTNSWLNTQCDATAWPEPLPQQMDNAAIQKAFTETASASSAASQSAQQHLLPLVAVTATLPVASSYLQALKSKSVITAGSTLLAVGGIALWNSLRPSAAGDADSLIPDTQPLEPDKSVEKENIVADCTCKNKRNLGSNDALYNDYFISNMPCQKEFQITDIPPRNSAAALNEIMQTMNAIVGKNNLRQYDSLELLKNALNDHPGKILVRRIENALNEGVRRINNAYQKFINPAEKDEILRYLSAALGTDNKTALEEAYERLRRTAFQTSRLVKNTIHLTGFFERRDKSIPLPSSRDNSPLVLVNRNNPALIKINLEEAESSVAELLDLQSSAGYNPELVEAFIRQMIMLGGNTQDLVTLPACQTEQGRSLGSYQRALLYFAIENQPAQALAGNGAVFPDDYAVREILNTPHNVTLTDEMRADAKHKLHVPQSEYYQRKTGKSAPTPHEQQEIANAITWVYAGSESDFRATKFFSDPVYRADIMTANTDSAMIYLRDIGAEGNHTAQTEDNLSANALYIDFMQKAEELRHGFSDPYKVARNLARNDLYQRTGHSLDPDSIFLHQFKQNQTVEDSNCFTGYAHNGQPLHSQTLTQAYMDNFKVFRRRHFSSFMYLLNRGAASSAGNGYLPDHLDSPELIAPFFTGPDKLSGLYQVNASATHFGAENEINYLPSVLKNDIYEANVMKHIVEQQQEFWRENSEAWRAMAKGQFIEEARLAYVNNTLSQQAYETVIKGGAANILLYDPVTMRELNESAAADPSVLVSFLNVRTLAESWDPIDPEPYESFYRTNILCFTSNDGREILYVAGDDNPFREFKDAKELETWLEQQIINDESRNAFLQHLSLEDRQSEVETALNDLAKSVNSVNAGEINYFKPAIVKRSLKTQFSTEDTFSALTQLTKERTARDADTLVSSNGEIVLESVHQILQAVSMLAVPLLPMLGPVGIALDIGLTAAQLGTGIGIMYTADTQDEYNGVLFDVGMSLLFLGLNGISAFSAAKNRIPSASSSHQALVKTNFTPLHQQPGFLQRIQSIREKGLSGRGAIMAGKNRWQRVKKPLGEDLNFRWIDDEIGETEKTLQKQLYSHGEGAAKLRDFRQNPTNLCYEAMLESYNSLKNQGEQPKVIGLLIYKTPWDDAPSNHFAVILEKDAADFVIDPTIRQFDPALPDEATILTWENWKALMIDKAGVGKDSVVVQSTFATPLLARLNVAELHTAKGKYFQSSLINKDNINILKHGNSFENSVIKEIATTEARLKALASDAVEYAYTERDLARLMLIKSHFSIFSPAEIKVTHQIKSSFKKQISKYAVPETEISALRSTGDSRGITSTVSGKQYIKINKNRWINIEPLTDSSFWIVFQGQKKLIMNFDQVKKKWFFPALMAKAKGYDNAPPVAAKPAQDAIENPGPSASKNALSDPSEARVAQPNINAVDPQIAEGSGKEVLMINHHDLPESTQLSEISMLGSHDAGTYDFSGFKSVGAIFPFAFKTQRINLKAQAMAGARYFDIRVVEKADGSFGFFHGPGVTGGDAVADVRELLSYAKEDSNNFYLFKFVFKHDSLKKGASITSSDKFLQQALEGYRENLITQKETSSLALAKVTLLNERKNLAVMVHKYHGSEPHWRYTQQVHTQWANHANAHRTAEFISTFHGVPAPGDKLTVIQTNMPYASVKNKELTLSVEGYLNKNADVIANAVDHLPSRGIISGDYIGTSVGASERFKMKINADNSKLLPPAQP